MKISSSHYVYPELQQPMPIERSLDFPSVPRTIAGLPVQTAVFYFFLFVIGLLVYGALWRNAPLMEDDSGGYLSVARDLSAFQLTQLHLRTPGYPVVLWLTGSTSGPTRALFFTSLALHFASVWLLGAALFSAGLRARALTLFALVLVLPPFVEYAGYILAENLAEFTLVLGFVSFVMWSRVRGTPWLIVSALAFAYSGLTRPVYQLLAFAVAGCLLSLPILFRWVPFRSREMVTPSVVLILTTVMAVGGYSYLNYRAFHYFGTSSQLGFVLSTKTLRVLERLPDEYGTVRDILVKSRDTAMLKDVYHTGYSGYVNDAVPKLHAATGLDTPELAKYMVRVNLLLIEKAPLEYLREVLWALCTYWFPSSNTLANGNSRALQALWVGLHFGIMSVFAAGLVVLIGTAAFITQCGHSVARRTRETVSRLRLVKIQAYIYILAGTIVLYSAVMACMLGVGEARFRVPTDSLIVFMCFLGADLWKRLVGVGRISFE
jgi:hypothetical protein